MGQRRRWTEFRARKIRTEWSGIFDIDPDDLDAIPSGGMGLSLITAVMHDVAYRSDQGQNVLTLRRRLRD